MHQPAWALIFQTEWRTAIGLLTGEVSVGDAIKSSSVPSLDIIAAVVELSAAEVELTTVDRREFRLADALAMSLQITIIF